MSSLTVGAVLQTIINSLKPQDQIELFNRLKQYLISQGLLEEKEATN
jgi:hypothetical protein